MFKRDKQPEGENRELSDRFRRFAARQNEGEDGAPAPARPATLPIRPGGAATGKLTDLFGATRPLAPAPEPPAALIAPDASDVVAPPPLTVETAWPSAPLAAAAPLADDDSALATPPTDDADIASDDAASWEALRSAAGLAPTFDQAAADAVQSQPAPEDSAADAAAVDDPWSHTADAWTPAAATLAASPSAPADPWQIGTAPDEQEQIAASEPEPATAGRSETTPLVDDPAAPDATAEPAPDSDRVEAATFDAPRGWSVDDDRPAADPYAFVDRNDQEDASWGAPSWRSETDAPAVPDEDDDYPILLRRPGAARRDDGEADAAAADLSTYFDLGSQAHEPADTDGGVAVAGSNALAADGDLANDDAWTDAAADAASGFFTPAPKMTASGEIAASTLRTRAGIWALPPGSTGLLPDEGEAAAGASTRPPVAWPTADGFAASAPTTPPAVDLAAGAGGPDAAPELPRELDADAATTPTLATDQSRFAAFARDWQRDHPEAAAAAQPDAVTNTAAPDETQVEPERKVSTLRSTVYGSPDEDEPRPGFAAGLAGRIKRNWFRETPDPLAIGAAVAIAAAVGLAMVALLFHRGSKPANNAAANATSAPTAGATASVAPTRAATAPRASVVAPQSAFQIATSAPVASVTPASITPPSRPATAPTVAAAAPNSTASVPSNAVPAPTTIPIATPVPAPQTRAARSAPFLPPQAASNDSSLPAIVGAASTNPGGALSSSAPPPAASAPVYSSGTGGSAASSGGSSGGGSAGYAPVYSSSAGSGGGATTSAASAAAAQPAAAANVSASLSSAAANASRAASAAGSRTSGH